MFIDILFKIIKINILIKNFILFFKKILKTQIFQINLFRKYKNLILILISNINEISIIYQ